LYTALAGGEVQVPTIHGDVMMKISPGAQPGELKKLSHKGIQDSSHGSGNHYVKINIEIPKYTSIFIDLMTNYFKIGTFQQIN